MVLNLGSIEPEEHGESVSEAQCVGFRGLCEANVLFRSVH